MKRKFKVILTNGEEALIKADTASCEYGALAFFNYVEDERPEVVQMFAPGMWATVEQVA